MQGWVHVFCMKTNKPKETTLFLLVFSDIFLLRLLIQVKTFRDFLLYIFLKKFSDYLDFYQNVFSVS